MSQRRCVIFCNASPEDGKVVLVPSGGTLFDFLAAASQKLGIDAKLLYNEHGAEIDDLALIRDNDIIYVSGGEKFRGAASERPAADENKVTQFNIAVLGAGAVGKSALTLRYVQGQFLVDYDPTIEDAYRKTTIVDGQHFMLDILDTAGQEDYAALRSTWMRERDGFVLVFSLVERQTFQELGNYFEQLLSMHENRAPMFVVAGNKVDIVSKDPGARATSPKQVDAELNEWWASSDDDGPLPAATYFETSALDATNVHEVFEALIRKMRDCNAAAGAQTQKKKRRFCTVL